MKLTLLLAEHPSEVVPPFSQLKGGRGVSLSQLVASNHLFGLLLLLFHFALLIPTIRRNLNLSTFAAFWDFEMPHPVKSQLPPAALVAKLSTSELLPRSSNFKNMMIKI